MVGLTTSMDFQQFKDLKFLIFFPEEHAPGAPKINKPSRIRNGPLEK